jgi:hypothetical protein
MRLRASATAVALLTAAMPVLANAACPSRVDMQAMEAATLQQTLMVAGFTCHASGDYNRFVLAHRAELQKSDAALLAYFQRNGGTAAYHTYKTHLANQAALTSSHSDRFCDDAGQLFQIAGSSGALSDVLGSMPLADTGQDRCRAAIEARAEPVRGGSQRVTRTARAEPTRIPLPPFAGHAAPAPGDVTPPPQARTAAAPPPPDARREREYADRDPVRDDMRDDRDNGRYDMANRDGDRYAPPPPPDYRVRRAPPPPPPRDYAMRRGGMSPWRERDPREDIRSDPRDDDRGYDDRYGDYGPPDEDDAPFFGWGC